MRPTKGKGQLLKPPDLLSIKLTHFSLLYRLDTSDYLYLQRLYTTNHALYLELKRWTRLWVETSLSTIYQFSLWFNLNERNTISFPLVVDNCKEKSLGLTPFFINYFVLYPIVCQKFISFPTVSLAISKVNFNASPMLSLWVLKSQHYIPCT